MISLTEPLVRAWGRMKLILFSPFDPGKWIGLGFTAWLASLAEGGTSGSYTGSRFQSHYKHLDWEDMATGTADRIRDFLESGLEIALVIFMVLAGLLVLLLLMWLSSRGAFMFLDNVVHNRSRVRDPWRLFARLADSLFLWRVLFTLATLLVVGTLLLSGVLMTLPLFGDGVVQGMGIAGLVAVAGLVIILGLVASFIELLVDHFVVPLMYKHDLTITAAWRMFLPLLKRELPHFLLYALFYLMLYIGVVVAVFVFAIVTCCVGLVVISIPFVGTVLLLPLYVASRGLGLEFLAQFGAEFSLRESFPELGAPGDDVAGGENGSEDGSEDNSEDGGE